MLYNNNMKTNKNLFILGAGGTVAHAFLVFLKNHRHLFGAIHLASRIPFHDDMFVALKELDATSEVFDLNPETRSTFIRMLGSHAADIVLDFSDAETELVSEAVFEYGKASYLCLGYAVESDTPYLQAIQEFLDKPKNLSMPHILFTGMNPGCVNVWAEVGISKFGKPQQMLEFEYDTSKFLREHKEKMVTWCLEEFLSEVVTDPSESMLGRRKFHNAKVSSLYHREDMEHLLAPLMPLKTYPQGCVVGHEECVTLADKHDMPCKFVYSVNLETMAHIQKLYETNGKVTPEDLVIGTNVGDPLVGADNIFMRLDYPDRYVYYRNAIQNKTLIDTSCTDMQVIIGIYAALFTLISHDLKPGIYFPEDLMDTMFPKFVTDNMMIEEFVFERNGDKVGALTSYNPHISYGSGTFIRL